MWIPTSHREQAMPTITHNLLSQFTNRQLNITGNNKSKSSGYHINRASDDAAILRR